jgi:hypothetical protein
MRDLIAISLGRRSERDYRQLGMKPRQTGPQRRACLRNRLRRPVTANGGDGGASDANRGAASDDDTRDDGASELPSQLAASPAEQQRRLD